MKKILEKLFTKPIGKEIDEPTNELLNPTLRDDDVLVNTKEELVAALKAMLTHSHIFHWWSREYHGNYKSLIILNASGCENSYVIHYDLYLILRDINALKNAPENDILLTINKLTRKEKIDNLLK